MKTDLLTAKQATSFWPYNSCTKRWKPR